jgi:hypothetical protein
MTRRPKPVMHGRDHAPDGPDPILGSTPQAVYTLAVTAVPAGALRYFTWTYTDGDKPLLDLSGMPYAAVLDDGVYAYSFAADWIAPTTADITANIGSYARIAFGAVSATGSQTGGNPTLVQHATTTGHPTTIHAEIATTVRQDAGGLVFAYVTDGTTGGYDYTGGCFVQKVS